MDLISYIGVLLISFLSIFVGAYIAYETEEELKSGKKYFQFTYCIVLALLLFFLLREYINNVLILIVAIIVTLFVLKLIKLKLKTFIFYALIFYLGSKNTSLPIVASLIFILGLLTGTLDSYKYILKKKKKDLIFIFKKLFMQYYLFMIIGFILYFLPF
ncbi:hypothetical protein HOD20_08960 [archaeon]|jgi:hypothetical protein|nr:hypothetical protein [archaeon]MBT4647233.1 hypothetical protein [archaeon]MBT6821030.1 hypothetical protein [archaeon]MBT7391459.1 hypothetical protein [archaeon]